MSSEMILIDTYYRCTKKIKAKPYAIVFANLVKNGIIGKSLFN